MSSKPNVWFTGLALPLSGWLVLASCAGGGDPERARDDAGTDTGSDAEAGGTVFATTSCGQCVSTHCASQATACEAEPSCAAYISCLSACPVDTFGDATSECEAACPRPSEGIALEAALSHAACREFVALKACTMCAKTATETDPILNQTCAASSETDTCKRCSLERCCNTGEACLKNPECAKITNCGGNCPSDSNYDECMAACFEQHPAGLQDYLNDLGCFLSLCSFSSACPWEAPGACSDCFLKNCAAAILACDIDAGCMLIELCISTCGATAACAAECTQNRAPESVAKFEARLICRKQNCAGECG